MWILFCLSSVLALLSPAWSQNTVTVGPRGNRPVEPGYKADTCKTEKEWPFCSDDDWGPKCPSGCRIQGLLDKADQHLSVKIDRIRKFLDDNRKHFKSTDQFAKQTYDYIRENLLSDTGNDNRYMSLAEQLRQRIISIKVKIDRQLKLLEALKNRVRDQVREMQRLEVDIDIKLRSCKGSCTGYVEYTVDRESYVTLEKHLSSLDGMKLQNVDTVGTLKMMKSRPMKDVMVSSVYKSGAGETAEQKQDFFGDVGQVKFYFEGDGSGPSAPVTVSKASGTAHQAGTGSGTGSGSSASSTTHVTTHTVKCTKTIRKKIVHTKDGPVETVEVIGGGGPECQELGVEESDIITAAHTGKDVTGDGYTVRVSGAGTSDMTSLLSELGLPSRDKSITTLGGGTGGGDDDFFKEFSTFTSSSSSKTRVVSDSTKGTKTMLGDDLGAFMHGDVEDDMPDIHARSVKSSAQRRKRDYVGKDCVDILQNHSLGDKSGLFKIKPEGTEDVVEVYCDQDTLLGGWVVAQQRMDGSINFNRTWAEYRDGFGSINQQGQGEMWLGNKYLHALTQVDSVLRVELEDWDDQAHYADYNIRVGPEAQGYALEVSDYTGDAGDALVRGQPNMGAFLSHAGMRFSTYDRDQDKWEENCAEMYAGGWWYNNCQSANLNGVYYRGGRYDAGGNAPYEIENGVVWLPLKPADYSLKTVRMKVRAVDTV